MHRASEILAQLECEIEVPSECETSERMELSTAACWEFGPSPPSASSTAEAALGSSFWRMVLFDVA